MILRRPGATRRLSPFLLLLITASGCSQPSLSGAPTVTLTPTTLPVTHTPTSTVTPTPTLTPIPSGPCDNPLMPLVAGNSWVYQISNNQGVTTQVITVGEITAESRAGRAEVELQDPDSGQVVLDLALCDQGEILDFPMIVTDLLLTGYKDSVLKTYRYGGLYAPSYATLNGSDWLYSWETLYRSENEVRIKDPELEAEGIVEYNEQFQYTWQMENERQAVTVQGGVFPQAWKVAQTLRVPAEVSGIPGFHGSVTLIIESTHWYEPFVGLVKAEIDSTRLLIGYGFETTLGFDTVVELLSFTPGQ